MLSEPEIGHLGIDADLLVGLKKQDAKAQKLVYEAHIYGMYNLAFRMMGSAEDAEDALQEAFLSAFAHIQQFEGKATFSSWLKRIVVNQCLALLKKKKNFSQLEEIPEEAQEYSEEVFKSDSRLSVDAIKKAISALPTGYRLVLSLYLFEGYDHQEIAEILGVTVSTSKSQYNRAKHRLRAILEAKS